jgi:hypothetical protein
MYVYVRVVVCVIVRAAAATANNTWRARDHRTWPTMTLTADAHVCSKRAKSMWMMISRQSPSWCRHLRLRACASRFGSRISTAKSFLSACSSSTLSSTFAAGMWLGCLSTNAHMSGRDENRALALSFFNSNLPQLRSNFAKVGGEEEATILRDAPHEYSVWASGRVHIQSLEVRLRTCAWHGQVCSHACYSSWH